MAGWRMTSSPELSRPGSSHSFTQRRRRSCCGPPLIIAGGLASLDDSFALLRTQGVPVAPLAQDWADSGPGQGTFRPVCARLPNSVIQRKEERKYPTFGIKREVTSEVSKVFAWDPALGPGSGDINHSNVGLSPAAKWGLLREGWAVLSSEG